jgi:DNA-binding NarL/FixJ family response regulator
MPREVNIGSTFAGHRIDALAGRGGMGVVYRATDLALDRPVALKLIAPALAEDPVFRARFERECRIAAAIDHPHAVQVFRAGEEDRLLFVTMRYVEGTDLGTLLADEGRLDPARAVALVGQVAGALDEAHAHGLVHRDVKPSNILVARRNGREHAFLTDFGLSKPMTGEPGMTKPGFVMGTADYMAPEHARGEEVDGRADVYALACVLFKTFTGSAPYERDSDLEKLWAHLHDPPPSVCDECPGLPRALEDVLHRGMAKEREDRYPSAGELAADAEAALHGTLAVAPVPVRASVVVAEDSVLLRAGIVHVLEDAGFRVVADAGDAEELLAAVRAHRPDVAVTDIRMPPTNTDEGLRAARTIRAEHPGTGVLVLSQYLEEDYALDLLGESAEGVGYLLKDRVADPRGFADAVREVAAGGSALDPEVVSQMLSRRRVDDPLEQLTARERDVLARMAEGQSNAAIAKTLGIGDRAVDRHVSAIFAKLGLEAGPEGHRRVLAVLTYLRA